jgi:hypothetical protein
MRRVKTEVKPLPLLEHTPCNTELGAAALTEGKLSGDTLFNLTTRHVERQP